MDLAALTMFQDQMCKTNNHLTKIDKDMVKSDNLEESVSNAMKEAMKEYDARVISCETEICSIKGTMNEIQARLSNGGVWENESVNIASSRIGGGAAKLDASLPPSPPSSPPPPPPS